MRFFGKLILTITLISQAYLLLKEKTAITEFDKQFALAMKNEHVSQLPKDITTILKQNSTNIRYGIVGLLASSALLLMFKCSYIAFFPIMGQLLLITFTSNPLLDGTQATLINLLKNLAILGGILLWASIDHESMKRSSSVTKKVTDIKNKKN